jgi:hypothetical protein
MHEVAMLPNPGLPVAVELVATVMLADGPYAPQANGRPRGTMAGIPATPELRVWATYPGHADLPAWTSWIQLV